VVLATTADDRLRGTRAESSGLPHDPASVEITAAALEAALRVRAPAHSAGTPLVRRLAQQVSRGLDLDEPQTLMVDACAHLRDVGMIGLPDALILNTGPLSPEEWASVNRHPELGAELLLSLPGMGAVARLVRAHHERWDGEGYPDGLRGDSIPLASRVVAVCDAFVAIATDRPHRRGAGAAGALEYLMQERSAQFDPNVVDCLVTVITGQSIEARTGPPAGGTPPPRRHAAASHTPGRASELHAAITEVDVIPVFSPACERALAAASATGTHAELVGAIEGDIGLTVAVLKLTRPGDRTGGVSVADAVARLGPAAIGSALSELPKLSFPWQTNFEALLLQSRVHAQAVARAADRLAQIARPFDRDDLVAAALLHDVGKLLLAKIWPDFGTLTSLRHTPEELVAHERRNLGYDHATLGAMLAQRWGLDKRLIKAVSEHHSAERAGETATFVRLADMVVHHAHGEAVDRTLMLRLAAACELSTSSLREVVFDQPHAGGSARRRAEPSPLSSRERAVLELIAEGMAATEVAGELHLSESTVRSHLHKAYAKLDVPDRAQAVLKATEMSWI
jgi:putative nucleotidyltransferase with HDIG domain